MHISFQFQGQQLSGELTASVSGGVLSLVLLRDGETNSDSPIQPLLNSGASPDGIAAAVNNGTARVFNANAFPGQPNGDYVIVDAQDVAGNFCGIPLPPDIRAIKTAYNAVKAAEANVSAANAALSSAQAAFDALMSRVG